MQGNKGRKESTMPNSKEHSPTNTPREVTRSYANKLFESLTDPNKFDMLAAIGDETTKLS